jgi:peptidoglycan DL-endopeptidase CwlO
VDTSRRPAAGLALTIMAVLAILTGLLAFAPAALASASSSRPAALAGRALDWAEAHALGHPYVYGGAGPGGYDCSGLIMRSVAAVGGPRLPHNAAAMVASGHLIRTSTPRRGDVAVWGNPSSPYHIEFVTSWPHTTFGAHHTGLAIGWRSYGRWYMPSAFYQLK